jgi:DNA repair ATPase RecN
MSADPLNENQRRYVATHLHLLLEDMALLGQMPELDRPERQYRRLRGALVEVEAEARQMMRELELPPRREHSLRQRVHAAANVWATRAHELSAKRLRAYGEVQDGLAARLDPLVAELRARLLELGDAAQDLPEAG